MLEFRAFNYIAYWAKNFIKYKGKIYIYIYIQFLGSHEDQIIGLLVAFIIFFGYIQNNCRYSTNNKFETVQCSRTNAYLHQKDYFSTQQTNK